MLKVIVIDDDNTVLIFMRRILQKIFDFEVVEAHDGLEALALMEKENPKIAFLDITMPNMDGYQFLQEIRKQDKYKDFPVIVITAANDRTILSKFLKLGIDDYLLKPMVYDEAKFRLKKSLAPVLSKFKKEIEEERIKEYESGN
ncbi:MAG TPA: response regulator [Melioribacteraceae bacterium]|nr:response regulator [Melioribacteraceae bacterium]